MTASRSEQIEDVLIQLAQHGTPGSAPVGLFDVGTGEYLKFFSDNILRDTVMAGGATCRFFEGSYGFGKTHLLRLIQDEAIKLGFAVVSTELTTDLRLESWDRITQYILQRVEYRAESGTIHGLGSLLFELGRSGSADLYKFMNTPLPHPGFKRAMEYAVRAERLDDTLMQYLSGERVRVTTLKLAGYPGVRDPLNARNAESVLQTVTRGLIALGLPGVALLFDETDQSFSARTASARLKVQVGANLIRRLIDACTTGKVNGLVSLFAVLPGFIEQCGQTYPALGQRLDREIRLDRSEAWRSPVVSVDSVSTLRSPYEFVSALAGKLVSLVEECNADSNGLKEELVNLGNQIVDDQAGSEYRRLVIRRLAMSAANRMELM